VIGVFVQLSLYNTKTIYETKFILICRIEFQPICINDRVFKRLYNLFMDDVYFSQTADIKGIFHYFKHENGLQFSY